MKRPYYRYHKKMRTLCYPPVILPTAVAFFADVVFCANVYVVVKFSTIIVVAANTAATIKPPK
jgi:hypothetical protein